MNFQFSKFASSANSGASPVENQTVGFRLNFQKRDNAGFTLIETMVALAVILAAVVGPAALVSRGLFNFSFSKNKIIAANLAQEGIELVRLVRDNNIMCDKLDDGTLDGSWEWTRDPRSISGGTMEGEWSSDAAGFVSFESAAAPPPCVSPTLTSPVLNPPTNSLLKLEQDQVSSRYGLYNYSTGNDTIFVRLITIDIGPSVFDGDIPQSEQMDIISTVEWIERGVHDTACPILESRCLTLQERFYNWK